MTELAWIDAALTSARPQAVAALLRRLASMVDDLVSASASSCIWEGDPEHDRCASCTAGFPEDCDRYPAAETADIDTQEVA